MKHFFSVTKFILTEFITLAYLPPLTRLPPSTESGRSRAPVPQQRRQRPPFTSQQGSIGGNAHCLLLWHLSFRYLSYRSLECYLFIIVRSLSYF
jgi:hypothetical protein